MTRSLKGLEDVITVSVVHPVWKKTRPGSDEHAGWVFGSEKESTDATMDFKNTSGDGGPFSMHYPDTAADPYVGAQSIREVYESVKDQDGKYTVPILFDKKTKTIVSNESSEIIRMLNTEFQELAQNTDLDIYPADMREAIEEVNEWVYPSLNNGVYRCGFAKSQEAYDAAIEELTNSFDKMDEILQKQRYIAGDRFTEADIRLFVTLVRFDEVYTVYFKTNTRSIMHTPSVLNYCREIYQVPGVKGTVNMEHIKTHYYCSHPSLNHYSIVPRGSNFLTLLEEPHDRDKIGN
jgi:putative glutathione S-transferase